MANAYRCDECGEFHEGVPVLRTTISVDVNACEKGFLGDLFGGSDGEIAVDLCSIACYQKVDLNQIRENLLADIDSKGELLANQPQAAEVTGDDPE